jgi:hypothetical protein
MAELVWRPSLLSSHGYDTPYNILSILDLYTAQKQTLLKAVYIIYTGRLSKTHTTHRQFSKLPRLDHECLGKARNFY